MGPQRDRSEEPFGRMRPALEEFRVFRSAPGSVDVVTARSVLMFLLEKMYYASMCRPQHGW